MQTAVQVKRKEESLRGTYVKLVGNSHRDIACSIGKSPQTPDHRNVWLTDSGNTYVERERQSLLQQDTEASHPKGCQSN